MRADSVIGGLAEANSHTAKNPFHRIAAEVEQTRLVQNYDT